MTKYFRILESNEYMNDEYGYEGNHDKGDIVATNNYNHQCFEATDEEDGDCTWIPMDHVEEVELNDVPLVARTKEHQLEIYTAFIDGKELQFFTWDGTWVEHKDDKIFHGLRFRIVTPEIKRAAEIEAELKVLMELTPELEADVEVASEALYQAQHNA